MAMTEGQAVKRARFYQVAGAVTFTIGFVFLISGLAVGDLGGPVWLKTACHAVGYGLMGLGGFAYVISGWIRGGGP